MADPVPLDDFFRLPALAGPSLSPSGRYLAVLIGKGNGTRNVLGVLDLDTPGAAKVVAQFADADIGRVAWINENRLVFSAYDSDQSLADRLPGGLWAVDRTGDAQKPLIRRTWRSGEGLDPSYVFGGSVGDDSDDVMLLHVRWDNIGEPQGALPYKLNTRTTALRLLGPRLDSRVDQWLFDRTGEPRVAVASSGGTERLYWRGAADTQWTLLEKWATNGVTTKMSPHWFDDRSIYVTMGIDPAKTSALFRYDVAARRTDDKPLFDIDGFDYGGGHVVDGPSGRVVGIRYVSDAEGTHWFDADLAAVQKEVDAKLQGTVNTVSCIRCIGADHLLVTARSDHLPAAFYLFHTRTRALEPLGASRPWIDPKQMADQDFVRIKARDGEDLPLYVTRPRGKSSAPRPAVVLVHGGPTVRGEVWGWNAEAQFLASRGYVVIEPEFRGGAGFGGRHLAAGFKQWGLAMQDDVTDATRWAVKEAGVDPDRVCIAGASYGGYAALMGLVREPSLYRCAVDWVGVTDPALLFTLHWSDLPDDWKSYGLRTLLGDPVADKQRFEETSPIAQAARITQPVLLAYGGADRRVPIEHGKRFRDAVTQHNKDVEWVVYADEGHGFGALANVHDFWQRVERFLARNTAPRKPEPPGP